MALSRQMTMPRGYSPQEPNGPVGTPGRNPFANGQTPYGNSQYVNSRGGAIPNNRDGQPIYSPDAGMAQNAGYYHDDPRQAPGGQWDQDHAASVARSKAQHDAMLADPKYADIMKSGNMSQRYQAERQYQHDQQTQNPTHGNQYGEYLLGGGTPQGWDTRFQQAWPTPTMANGQRGPGAPVSAGGPMQAPPPMPSQGSQTGNGMITGYQPMQSALSNMQGAMNGGGQPAPGTQQALMGALQGSLQGSQGNPPSSGTSQGGGFQTGTFYGNPQSTGGNQGALAADAGYHGGSQAALAAQAQAAQGRGSPFGGFNPPSGPMGRPTIGNPPPQPFPGPRDGGGNPYANSGSYGYTPFQGSSWGGNVGYDMGGMSQMFNGMGGGGYGSQMSQPQYMGGGQQAYGAPSQMNMMNSALQQAQQQYGGGGGYGGLSNAGMMPYGQMMQMGLGQMQGGGGYNPQAQFAPPQQWGPMTQANGPMYY